MSLGEKILKLRKKKGLSQEELGDKVKVTRQTISNWELGETSPNPEQLKLLSKELSVSIDELLDNDLNNLLVEKVSNTESVTQKVFMLLKIIAIVFAIIIVIFFILVVTKIIIKSTRDYGPERTSSIHCKLYGEEHSFGITYYELTGVPTVLGGDTYFSDILDLDKYNNAHQIFNVINDYVKKNGGTCEIIDDNDLNNMVSMYIKEGTLTNTNATIVIETNNDYEITLGEYFTIEKYDYSNNTWTELPIVCNDCAFNDIAYIVTSDNSLELNHDWTRLYGSLPKGEYRILKDAFFESDTPINEDNKFYIWTEFTID